VLVATYVLVPGAWLGGWVWNDVARDLRDRGHDIYPATLTGLGERVHLGGPEVDLDTHVADVVNLIAFEDLHDVTLVGHSYAGIVVTAVADRIPGRLARLIYLDAAPFESGMSLLDLYLAEARENLERLVAETGNGWQMPFPPLEELGAETSLAGLEERDLALMREKATPHPFGTYRQPLRLGPSPAAPGTFEHIVIACDDIRGLIAAGIPPIVALTQPPWRYEELATGHWPMLSAPGELAALLDRLGAS
jgi:pimeloyl-ACP methyl ester carboxylesterase